MTVPGINVICAAILAAVGDIRRSTVTRQPL
jgi:hypothetical protein